MEATTLEHPHLGVRGPTPLLRLQGDERLVALTRRGNQAAYEALVARYQSRLLAFCRHMLGSKEDAEDVLQEVFAAAFNAMIADDRPINVRPWLYRIARNRSLNHLRRQQAIGVDSMDVHFADHGKTTAEQVHGREAFRELLEDVKTLPETQRTALLLREIDALSYEQISEAMETTVPSVKSLLVRARVSLAEAAEARAPDLRGGPRGARRGRRGPAPHEPAGAPPRAHVRPLRRLPRAAQADQQGARRDLPGRPADHAQEVPARPGRHDRQRRQRRGRGAAPPRRRVRRGAAGAGSALTAGVGAVATKAAAGLAAAAIVTAGAVEVDHAQNRRATRAPVAAAKHAPAVVAAAPRVVVERRAAGRHDRAAPRHRRPRPRRPKPVKKPAAGAGGHHAGARDDDDAAPRRPRRRPSRSPTSTDAAAADRPPTADGDHAAAARRRAEQPPPPTDRRRPSSRRRPPHHGRSSRRPTEQPRRPPGP